MVRTLLVSASAIAAFSITPAAAQEQVWQGDDLVSAIIRWRTLMGEFVKRP